MVRLLTTIARRPKKKGSLVFVWRPFHKPGGISVIQKHDYSDYDNMKSRSGFTLIEAMLGMMVLLTAASFIAPAFVRDLVLGRVMWERRLAVKTIEAELDWACNFVQMPPPAGVVDFDPPGGPAPDDGTGDGISDFTQLSTGALTTLIPSELPIVAAKTSRVVACVDPVTLLDVPLCTGTSADLKRVRVTVTWLSRGHEIDEASGDYFLSRSGICGDG